MAWHGLSIFSIIETPGAGSVVCIVNLALLELPLVWCKPGWAEKLVNVTFCEFFLCVGWDRGETILAKRRDIFFLMKSESFLEQV